MADLTHLAKTAVTKLLAADEEQLYEQLGMRAKAIAENPSSSGSFDLEVTYDQAQMGLKDDVREFGQSLFQRWNRESYNLICGSDPEDKEDRKELTTAFGMDSVMIAAVLAGLLVSYLGLAPAIAAVIAAIIVKRYFRPGYEEFCRIWKKKLPSVEQEDKQNN